MKKFYKLVEKGNYKKAIIRLKEAEIDFEAPWEKPYYIAECYKMMHCYEDAIEYFEYALSMRFDEARIHYGLGSTLSMALRYDEAIDAFKNVIAVNPERITAYGKIGVIYAKKGDFDNAISWLRLGIGRLERFIRSEVSKKDKWRENAELWFGYNGTEDSKERSLIYAYMANYLGVCYFETHRYKEAKRWFVEAMERMPVDHDEKIASYYMDMIREKEKR